MEAISSEVITAEEMRSAIVYSIIVSCQRHGKDPHAYLKDVLTLPKTSAKDDLRSLLPINRQPA